MYRPRLQGGIPMWWLHHTLVPEDHWLLDTVWAEDRHWLPMVCLDLGVQGLGSSL